MMGKDNYRSQIDKFCDENCNVNAEDIYRLAVERDIEKDGKVMEFKTVKKKKAWMKGLATAACFLVMGTTVLAATGTLEEIYDSIYDKYFKENKYTDKDEVTPEIIDEGYLYEVGLTEEEDIFKVDFVAVSGDDKTPVLLFDVYVNDEELAAANDNLRMLAYTLGVDEYENQLDEYGPNEAYGEKDAEIPNLYHVSMVGAPVWMCSGEPVVVCVSQLNFGLENEIWNTYEVCMEYRFTPPATSYHPTTTKYYDGQDVVLENDFYGDNIIRYSLERIEYGPYRADVYFKLDTPVVDTGDVFDPYETLLKEWKYLLPNVKLVVDDVEYSVEITDENIGFTCLDEDGDEMFSAGDNYGVWASFPSIDYGNVTCIQLKCGDDVFTLK